MADLIQISTPEEIKVYDEIIAARPEYDIFINLSRGLEPPNSSLVFTPEKLKDDFKRSGLFWLTALGRIEFATTQAIFNSEDNAFLKYAPAGDESLAYFKVLMDSFKSHYYDTIDTPQLKLAITSSNIGPDQRVLAYVRRLSLMADMYIALMPVARNQFTPEQLAELKQMGKQVHRNLYGLTNNVNQALQSKNGETIGSTTDTSISPVYRKCEHQCRRLAQAFDF